MLLITPLLPGEQAGRCKSSKHKARAGEPGFQSICHGTGALPILHPTACTEATTSLDIFLGKDRGESCSPRLTGQRLRAAGQHHIRIAQTVCRTGTGTHTAFAEPGSVNPWMKGSCMQTGKRQAEDLN